MIRPFLTILFLFGAVNPFMIADRLPSRLHPLQSLVEQSIDDTPPEEVLPTYGVSIADEMAASTANDVYKTQLYPLHQDSKCIGAQLVSTAKTTDAFCPSRYLLSLHRNASFALVDVPPYSDELVQQLHEFMGNNSTISTILVTSKDALHVQGFGNGVYSSLETQLDRWIQAFPDVNIVGYRLDIPRDARKYYTNVLDGYGPFGWTNATNVVELGPPLTMDEWEEDDTNGILQQIIMNAENDEETSMVEPDTEHHDIRDLSIVGVYTPGHTFGSVSYIFPALNVCCSGFCIPLDTPRQGTGTDKPGPPLDCRGYIGTNKAGITRQMESAEQLVASYAEHFDTVLPARGDPLLLDGDVHVRQSFLQEIIEQYKKIGEIYENLGITAGP